MISTAQPTQTSNRSVMVLVLLATLVFLVIGHYFWQFGQEIELEPNSLFDGKRYGGKVSFSMDQAMMKLKAQARAKFRNRLSLKEAACQKHRHAIGSHLTDPMRWYYTKEYKLLHCSNPKAGSTTMKLLYGLLLNPNYIGTHRESNLKEFRAKGRTKERVYPLQELSKKGLTSGIFVFTTTRHPFAHLVSAYYKFLKFRPSYDKRNKDIFVYLNATESKNIQLSPMQVSEYLTSGEVQRVRGMAHFKPYFQSCNYCDVEFDAIVDLGELEVEIQSIARNLNITVWKKKVHANTRRTPAASDDVKKFFSQVTLDMAKKLYEYYKYDFEMFGYDPKPYYRLCKA